MGPFLGPVESVPTLKGPKNGPKSGPAFWPRFSHKLALSSELFNLENSKQNGREQKPRESYDFLCRIAASKQLLMSKLVPTTTGEQFSTPQSGP